MWCIDVSNQSEKYLTAQLNGVKKVRHVVSGLKT
jgi:hypothetical protein